MFWQEQSALLDHLMLRELQESSAIAGSCVSSSAACKASYTTLLQRYFGKNWARARCLPPHCRSRGAGHGEWVEGQGPTSCAFPCLTSGGSGLRPSTEQVWLAHICIYLYIPSFLKSKAHPLKMKYPKTRHVQRRRRTIMYHTMYSSVIWRKTA